MNSKPFSSSFRPRHRRAIRREVSGELLLYLEQEKRAHCLNPIAAEIWQNCDGKKTVPEIVAEMKRRNISTDEPTVWGALRQFSRRGLLEARPPNWPVDHRRRKLLIAGAGLLGLPMITSVFIPEAEAAASCATLGQSCNPKPCCTPLTCVVNRCV